jgi:transcriptional regulator with XRE-family HTH domain
MSGRRTALAARRAAMGHTQESLAGLLRIERSTVTRWEQGKSTPQPWVRRKLAGALSVTIEALDELLTQDQSERERDALPLASPAGSVPELVVVPGQEQPGPCSPRPFTPSYQHCAGCWTRMICPRTVPGSPNIRTQLDDQHRPTRQRVPDERWPVRVRFPPEPHRPPVPPSTRRDDLRRQPPNQHRLPPYVVRVTPRRGDISIAGHTTAAICTTTDPHT